VTLPQKVPSHALPTFPGWEPLHEPPVGISRERGVAGMCSSFPSSSSRTCCLTSRWPGMARGPGTRPQLPAVQPSLASTIKQEKKPPAASPRSCVRGDETPDPSCQPGKHFFLPETDQIVLKDPCLQEICLTPERFARQPHPWLRSRQVRPPQSIPEDAPSKPKRWATLSRANPLIRDQRCQCSRSNISVSVSTLQE